MKPETKVISAKVPLELLEKMDEVQAGLGIPTRNELIIRAAMLYYASYRYGMEEGKVINKGG
ncbi:MAG: ribbon-helix-helix domain-containing protein [Candidatus Methanoplasma sp.]|jgi:metal-responsive CopG/Arc/MetJ family transcriptional regulator|nr:ribbon-helix-helix domain-containing protein [Candidatus Methanoplasma sp.]